MTLVWFAVLGALGVRGIVGTTSVLAEIDAMYAMHVVGEHGLHGLLVLGAVFLAITGAEALYADMGHFGRRPIRLAWLAVVLPALVLNYFGQGALLLKDASAAARPFYRLAPEWSLIPLVILATAATCIASQALISGAFSLTRQAAQLGFFPRVNVVHTSSGAISPDLHSLGELDPDAVHHWLVLGFAKSTNLAAAYGIAVALTMLITTLLAFASSGASTLESVGAGALTAVFLFVDVSFLTPTCSRSSKAAGSRSWWRPSSSRSWRPGGAGASSSAGACRRACCPSPLSSPTPRADN